MTDFDEAMDRVGDDIIDADRMKTATKREEFLLEGLLVSVYEQDSAARWERWGGPFSSLEDSLAVSRLAFLREKKAHAHSGEPQPELRILDYRVLRREVVTTEWEEVETS